MDEMRMFAQLDAADQERVIRVMEAFVSKDQQRAAWAWLVCRIAADATGDARRVALLYVEDGLTWQQVARQTGFSVSWCHRLYNKAMAQVNAGGRA